MISHRHHPPVTVLAHHWMEFFRGGEAVLEQFGRLFPAAPICLMVYNWKNLSPGLRRHPLRPSFLQRVPWLRRHFRSLLPVFPEIVRSMRIPAAARFVLSSDASMIKGINVPVAAIHVCYCHSPPRYLWGLEEAYLQSQSHRGWISRRVFTAVIPRLRAFDWAKAQQVDRFIANSRCVQERIRRCYGRESEVIYPPVNVDDFDATRPREDFFLIVSALVPYKRVDLAVDACSRLGRRLVVIGAGPEEEELRRRAAANVIFLGWQSNAVVRDYYERCRALLFPGIEDFGITPCEAQAAGAPVIALAEGGALETVRDGETGLFFPQQTVESLLEALRKFEAMPPFDSQACRANVRHLHPACFRRNLRDYLERELPELFSGHAWPEEESVNASPLSSKIPAGFASANSDSPTRPARQSPAPPLPWWAVLAGGIGVAGVFLTVYLTLRPSSILGTISWLPAAVARWADEHGRFRNFPAYVLLTLPCLMPFRRPTARVWVVGALVALGCGLEFAQRFIATRWFEYQDIAWSWAGVLAAWGLVETALRCPTPFRRPVQREDSST